MDSLYIGECPPEEKCAQVGQEDYQRISGIECRAYIELLRRKLGPEPEGARLVVKSEPHDYGSYKSVHCNFDSSVEIAVEYAYKCEGEGPTEWDELARKSLIEQLGKGYFDATS